MVLKMRFFGKFSTKKLFKINSFFKAFLGLIWVPRNKNGARRIETEINFFIWFDLQFELLKATFQNETNKLIDWFNDQCLFWLNVVSDDERQKLCLGKPQQALRDVYFGLRKNVRIGDTGCNKTIEF